MKHNLILIAHHDSEFAQSARVLLEAEGYRTDAAVDGGKALSKIRQLQPKVVITDLCAPAINCFELIRSIRSERLPTTILLAPEDERGNDLVQALDAGAYDFVLKPILAEAFVPAVRRAVERQELLDELLALRKALDGSNGYVLGVSEKGISLGAVERELLARALDKFSGNQTQAAKYLDISRRTLIYRMEKYHLRRELVPEDEA